MSGIHPPTQQDYALSFTYKHLPEHAEDQLLEQVDGAVVSHSADGSVRVSVPCGGATSLEAVAAAVWVYSQVTAIAVPDGSPEVEDLHVVFPHGID